MIRLRLAATALLVLCLLHSAAVVAVASGPPAKHPGGEARVGALAAKGASEEQAVTPGEGPPEHKLLLRSSERPAEVAVGPRGTPAAHARGTRPELAGRPRWVRPPEAGRLVEPSVEETGVAQARTQIERNIERSEMRVDQGLMSRVPQGLRRALEVLMSWVGFEVLEPVEDE